MFNSKGQVILSHFLPEPWDSLDINSSARALPSKACSIGDLSTGRDCTPPKTHTFLPFLKAETPFGSQVPLAKSFPMQTAGGPRDWLTGLHCEDEGLLSVQCSAELQG